MLDRAIVLSIFMLALALADALGGDAAKAKSWIHPRAARLPHGHMGPFVTLGDGSILAAGTREVLVSRDEGTTWAAHRLFQDPAKFQVRPERALLRTRDGVVILVFMNQKELRRGEWKVHDKAALAKFYLPTYVTRSLDEGKTWEKPQKLQGGWCGAIRSLIQLKTGRIVLCGQNLVFDPGRHVVMTYTSDDNGKTWQQSNILDIGGAGSHGGTMEGTAAELTDGRVWMLIRTTRGWFWEAFSNDGARTWTGLRKSAIRSSTCCGTLARLASRRLLLLWNRSPVLGGKKPYSLHSREELSMAFSTDDGTSWTEPVVIARDPGKRQSYPYVYERRPGELWITTMQGKVRIRLLEKDFAEAK